MFYKKRNFKQNGWQRERDGITRQKSWSWCLKFFFIPHILVQDPLSNSEDSLQHLGLNRINFLMNFRRKNKNTGLQQDFKFMRLWWGGSSGYWLLVTSLVNVAVFWMMLQLANKPLFLRPNCDAFGTCRRRPTCWQLGNRRASRRVCLTSGNWRTSTSRRTTRVLSSGTSYVSWTTLNLDPKRATFAKPLLWLKYS